MANEALICTPTKKFQDFQVIDDWIKKYRQAGGKVPPVLEAAIEAARAGKNFEDSMNTTCDQLSILLHSNQEYCARYAGFNSVADMKETGGSRFLDVDQYDLCMLQSYYRTEANERIKAVLYIGDPKSFVSTFSASMREQLTAIIGRWAKGKAKEKLAPKPPPYENPRPAR